MIVHESRKNFKETSWVLDKNPEILDLVHEDLKQLSERDGENKQGRKDDFTSETILWALIVHVMSGDSLREMVIRIAKSEFWQDFPRTRQKTVMNYLFLDKCLLFQPSMRVA